MIKKNMNILKVLIYWLDFYNLTNIRTAKIEILLDNK